MTTMLNSIAPPATGVPAMPGQAPAPAGMGAQLKQLIPMLPAIIAEAQGNPGAMKAMLEGYQQTLNQMQARSQSAERLGMDQTALQSDLTRQAEQDRIAAEDRQRRMAVDRVTIGSKLAEAGSQAETPQGAESAIDALYNQFRNTPDFEPLAASRDAAIASSGANISNRKKGEFRRWVAEELPKSQFMAEIQAAGGDADVTDALAAKAPRMLEIARQMRPGQERFKASDLFAIAEVLQPDAPVRTRIPAAPGSQEEFSDPNTTPERKAQILADRKAYQQVDDRAPRVTVNTGTNDARLNARIDRLASAFNASPLVKEFNEVQAQHQTIRQVVSNAWSGPGDMSIIFAFMKALDPNSVVRETEYDNAAKSGNIFAGWAAKFNGALNPSGGFMSEQVKADFLKTIEARMGVKKAQYDNLRVQTAKKIDRIKAGDPETGNEALIDYGSAFPADAAPAGGGGAPKRGANPFKGGM